MNTFEGKSVLHYRLIKQAGRGGMGIVYKAEDTKLDRIVAIKFLPPHVDADEEENRRFVIEAKAAASLNHPNIATIHSIEKSDDDAFIVMEFIDGIELKDKIRDGAIPAKEAVIIAVQIAEGLLAAHKKGIVHRDIKSQNIMITGDGKIKIMDFGLAKVKGNSQLTKMGSTVGTTSYMSPEQAKCEEVDHRTDIWSFGVVLYEMISGRLPFSGDYEQAIIYSILNEEPELEYSPELNSIIIKALAKNRDERYQSVQEVLDDLLSLSNAGPHSKSSAPVRTRGKSLRKKKKNLYFAAAAVLFTALLIAVYSYFSFLSGPGTASERKMIVVLPFDNLGSSEVEYFADGITGEITSKLSGLSGLGVIARSSAMQYKNSEKSLKEIGEELGVEYVLEGTIQWEQLVDGKKWIRVNPELINIENSTQMWSKPYEAEFSSAFTLQSEIASSVAEALNLKLILSERKNLDNVITHSPEAYDLYLKGRYYVQDITDEKNQRIAREMLQKAIELDNQFAEAYAGLSTVQSNMHWSYFERSAENLSNSERNALKALQIKNDLPEGHVALGDFYYHGILDYDSALKEYYKALSLKPSHFEAQNGIGFVLRRQGKMREAIEQFKRAIELNPKDFQTQFSIGETYCLIREYEKALPFLDKAALLVPEATPPASIKARAYLLGSGDTKKARTVISDAMERKIGLDSYHFQNILYLCDIIDGDYPEALKRVKNLTEENDQYFYKVPELYAAQVYGFMKDRANELKHYNTAVNLLKAELANNPDDSRLYSSLGIAYAGLGEKENAITAGKKGYELLPVEKDAWRGTFRLADLAEIYTMTGEHESALDIIEKLLSMPTDVLSHRLLKLDPTWKSLTGNPRFQKLTGKI